MRGAPENHHPIAAVLALHQAVEARLQHPDQAALLAAVQRGAAHAIQAATATGPLAIGLGAHGARFAGSTVPQTGGPLSPFGPLRRAGIAELRLEPGITSDELTRLVQHLARATHDSEGALAALRGDAGIRHVVLLAARGVSDEAAARDEPGGPDAILDWASLPGPTAGSTGLPALVARDLACNLPALAARQVLDDLAADPAAPPGAEEATGGTSAADDGMLQRLLGRTLAHHDLATAGWLLAEAAREPAVPPTLLDGLQATAAAAVQADGWLDALLARGHDADWAALDSFATQLPATAAAWLAAHVADASHPRARWLRDLLG